MNRNLRKSRSIDQRPGSNSDQNSVPSDSHSSADAPSEELLTQLTCDVPSCKPAAVTQESCDSRCWLKRSSQIPDHVAFTHANPAHEDLLTPGEASTVTLYKELKSHQTRLAVLPPAKQDEMIAVSVIEVDIIDEAGMGAVESSEIVAYEALSYSWADDPRDTYILCNGQPLRIPAQSAMALTYLRSPTQKRYIWCDAICINQENLKEKAVQVKHMFRIFEKAETVIAWLGTPLLSCDRFIASLQLSSDPGLPAPWFWQRHEFTCATIAAEISSAIVDIFKGAWFRRTWIRQEVCASRVLKLQIGQHSIDFLDFLHKVEHMDKILRLVFPGMPTIERPVTLHTYTSEYRNLGADRSEIESGRMVNYTEYWLRTLFDGARFEVTDERDRIYATLGILMNENVRFISRAPVNVKVLFDKYPVSYEKPVSEVFQDVMKFLINSFRNLEVLDYFPVTYWPTHIRALSGPSWCFDWKRQVEHIGFFQRSEIEVRGSVKVLEQDHTLVDRLRLEGLTVVRNLTMLNEQKEIGHPRDRFNPKYRRSITIGDLVCEPRRSSPSFTSPIRWKNNEIPYAFVFSYMSETETSYEFTNEVITSTNMTPGFVNHLTGQEYVFGYALDFSGDDSLEIEDLTFLLPRDAMLDDVLVSLYGSKCLHLLRPVANTTDEGLCCQYVSPVVALVYGADLIAQYSDKSRRGSKVISKSKLLASGSKRARKSFELI